MNWEDILDKETVERIDDITVAIKSLDKAMEYIKESCKPCGRCSLDKNTCDVNKSYKKIKKAREELESFRDQLENSIR